MSAQFPFAKQSDGDLDILESELRAGLERFWQTVGTILEGGTIHLVGPEQSAYSLARNFFSTLFLYSYYRVGIPAERRILYVAVNQCLRGMVTGCDNLLDDEYKITLETDLPHQAHRFRSVLDIMVADRVLFAILVDHCRKNDLAVDLALRASAASLQALTESGAQEATEEGGVGEYLQPEEVLTKVHHYKTGLLFQSPWAVPAIFEGLLSPEAERVRDALYHIGIGCQMLDDLVDVVLDVRGRRHNYLASVIVHEESAAVWESLQLHAAEEGTSQAFLAAWPKVAADLKDRALATLENGLRALFLPQHQGLVHPAAVCIAGIIGVSIQ
jgi:hypothetical protein